MIVWLCHGQTNSIHDLSLISAPGGPRGLSKVPTGYVLKIQLVNQSRGSKTVLLLCSLNQLHLQMIFKWVYYCMAQNLIHHRIVQEVCIKQTKSLFILLSNLEVAFSFKKAAVDRWINIITNHTTSQMKSSFMVKQLKQAKFQVHREVGFLGTERKSLMTVLFQVQLTGFKRVSSEKAHEINSI